MHDIKALRSDLTSARNRYETRYRHDISQYRKAVRRQFQMELDRVLSGLVRDRNLAVVNEVSRSLLFQSILSEGETGMDLCVWGPPLGIFPLNDLGYGLVAYGTLGMTATALTHRFHPEKTFPFTDYLDKTGMDERTARAVCIMTGTAVLNAVAKSCLVSHLPDIAQRVMRTSQHFSKGIVARSSQNSPQPNEIRMMRRDMPRLMMLEHIFVRTVPSPIRFPLLRIASGIHWFRQMMRYGENSGSLPLKIAKNDDRNGSQALTHLMDRIASIREKAAALNPGCRDAVDMRIGTI